MIQFHCIRNWKTTRIIVCYWILRIGDDYFQALNICSKHFDGWHILPIYMQVSTYISKCVISSLLLKYSFIEQVERILYFISIWRPFIIDARFPHSHNLFVSSNCDSVRRNETLVILGLKSMVFTSDTSTSTSTRIGALCQVKMNATQAQENETFWSLCLCLRLCQGCFHSEISPLMLELVFALLVKTRLKG